MAANGSPEKLSPMRSLSSFKSEIPLTKDCAKKNQKNTTIIQQHLDHIINSIPLYVSILVLIMANCFVIGTELLFAYGMFMMVDQNDKKLVLQTLSGTSLALLSLFLLEVVVRIFSMGLNFKRKKLEMFDACVVLVAFVSDLIIFVKFQESHPFTRAFSFIIILRMWRCWGILHGAKKRVREETVCELQMEKYARRQAEAQADALQAQCDQQLIEIAYLRDFLHQNNLDLDTTKLDFVRNYQKSTSVSSGIHYDKADTLPAKDRLSKDVSLDSLASSSMNPPTSLSSSQNIYSEPPAVISEVATSSNGPHHQTMTNEQFALQASRQIVQEAISEVHETIPPSREGLTNPGFTPDEEGMPPTGSVLRMTEEQKLKDGLTNEAFENDSLEPGSPKSDSEEESEAQLRIELDEIRRLSEEALRSELQLSSLTHEVDGIPTTSL